MKIILVLLLLSGISFAQSILSINEEGHGNVDITQNAIVDVNATLSIKIDTANLRKKSAGMNQSSDKISAEDISQLSDILKSQAEMLGYLGASSESRDKREMKLKNFSIHFINLLKIAKKYPAMKAEIESVYSLNGSDEDVYKKLGIVVETQVKKATDELAQTEKENRIYIRLGGWLYRKSGQQQPIHIPGFDNYSEGKYYDVPRFVNPSSKEIEQQLTLAKDAADAFNDTAHVALSKLKDAALELCDSISDSLHTFISIISDSLIEKLSPKARDSLTSLTNRCKIIFQSIASFRSKVLTITQRSLINSIEVLSDGKELWDSLTNDIRLSIVDIDSIINDPRLKDINNVIANSWKNKALKASRYFSYVLTTIDNTQSSFDDLSKSNAGGLMSANIAFGEAVNRFNAENIPSKAELDLRTIGSREEGDKVVFKLGFEQQSQTGSQTAENELEIERRSVILEREDWYTTLTFGPAFLSPTARDSSHARIKGEFQAAPSYSLLFRWGWRCWGQIGKYLTPGIGINISSPDFNLDGVPELGIGATISEFDDYLQAGVGRDIGVDTWYLFFMIRVPVALIGMSSDDVSGKLK